MNIDISKYFWDLNEDALKKTEGILKSSGDPKFVTRMVTFLSRCDQPKELFSLISKKEFIEFWPKIRAYWRKIAQKSEFRDWWETIYEQILQEYGLKKNVKGKSPASFLKIGRMIKEARIQVGLSQKELASMVAMKQPDISMIEEGKKNITLETLLRLCRVLDIDTVNL